MDDGDAYRVADLFSGAGGLSLGFDRPQTLNGIGDLDYSDLEHSAPGFETVIAVERNEDAARTYFQNFTDGDETRLLDLNPAKDMLVDYERINTPRPTIVNGDISWLDFGHVDCDIDLVIGGPPCQGFSLMNQKTLEELREHEEYAEMNQLWQYFITAVEHLDPEMFLIENVGRFLDSIEAAHVWNRATDLGYTLTIDLLEAQHYGVPQKRTRGFILGSKAGHPPLPPKTVEHENDIRTVRDAIGDLPHDPEEREHDELHVGRTQKEITERRMEALDTYDPETGYAPDRTDLPEDLLPPCWKGDHSGHTDHYGRLYSDKPSVTIRTGFTQPMKGRHVHYAANRALTPREGARLQTFPDEFNFTGSKNRQSEQIGNAVPPKLAYELAQAMLTHLETGRTISDLPKKTLEIKSRAEQLNSQSTLDKFA